MGEIVHTAKIRLVQKKQPFRDAYIEGFAEPLHFGAHGGYAQYYGVKNVAPPPTPIDPLIFALAGLLTRTLARALEARGNPPSDNLGADGERRLHSGYKIFCNAARRLRHQLK